MKAYWIVITVWISGGFALGADSTGRILLGDILRPVDPARLEVAMTASGQDSGEAVEEHKPTRLWIGREAVLRRLEQYLEEGLPEGDRVALSTHQDWRKFPVESEAEWWVRPETGFTPDDRGRWAALLSILVDGEVIETRRIAIKVALYRDVWVAQRNLIRGSVPREPVIAPVLRDVFSQRGSVIAATEDLSGYALRRNVAEGHLLTWDDLEKRPLVRKGEMVDVVVQRGMMRVSLRARSLEDGADGDWVNIRNPNTRFEFLAQVTGRSQVSFEP